MGSEISKYQAAAVRTISELYGGWPVFERQDATRITEDAWSVEVGVVGVELFVDGYNNQAQLMCQASIRYASKAPTHDRLAQACDIACSLGSGINHNTMVDGDGNATGEIVHDVRVFTEVETIVRGGVRVATGGYRVILQWADRVVVSPDIEIEGYTVTSPSRPPAQPGIDPPVVEEITGISLVMPPGADFAITEPNPNAPWRNAP